MADLKPCPFCKSTNLINKMERTRWDDFYWIIECLDCSGQMRSKLFNGYLREECIAKEKETIQAWNRRAKDGSIDKG